MKIAILLVFIFIVSIAQAAELVNINTADATRLDTLPGVGPVRASAIISYREEHGPFARTDDLVNVKGIGPVTFENVKALITVGTSSAPKPKTSTVQPSPTSVSSNTVKKVATVTKPLSQPAHEITAVAAPAAVTKVTAAGAPMSSDHLSFGALLTSRWTLGFAGVVVFAGAALVLL